MRKMKTAKETGEAKRDLTVLILINKKDRNIYVLVNSYKLIHIEKRKEKKYILISTKFNKLFI